MLLRACLLVFLLALLPVLLLALLPVLLLARTPARLLRLPCSFARGRLVRLLPTVLPVLERPQEVLVAPAPVLRQGLLDRLEALQFPPDPTLACTLARSMARSGAWPSRVLRPVLPLRPLVRAAVRRRPGLHQVLEHRLAPRQVQEHRPARDLQEALHVPRP